jgi:hypothetical protein
MMIRRGILLGCKRGILLGCKTEMAFLLGLFPVFGVYLVGGWLESMMTARGRVGRRDIPNRLVGWAGVQERQSSIVVKSLIKIV